MDTQSGRDLGSHVVKKTHKIAIYFFSNLNHIAELNKG